MRSGDEPARPSPPDDRAVEAGRGLVRADLRRSLTGGALAAVVVAAAMIAVGRLTAFQARELIEGALPAMQFLTSAVLAAGATILALMLTLLGVSYTTEFRFRADHYRRIRHVSLLTTVTIVFATLMLLTMTVPLQEAEELDLYYAAVYYVLTAASALVGGLTVAVVLMLNDTVRSLAAVGLGESSELVDHEDLEPEEMARRYG